MSINRCNANSFCHVQHEELEKVKTVAIELNPYDAKGL